MSVEQIQNIRETARALSAETNKAVVFGQVPFLQKTWGEIFPFQRQKGEKFFYRQAETAEEPERWTITGRDDLWTSVVYLTNRTKGEILLAHKEQHFAWLRAQNSLARERSFALVQEETTALLSRSLASFFSGNRIETRFNLIQARKNLDEMLLAIDRQMSGEIIKA